GLRLSCVRHTLHPKTRRTDRRCDAGKAKGCTCEPLAHSCFPSSISGGCAAGKERFSCLLCQVGRARSARQSMRYQRRNRTLWGDRPIATLGGELRPLQQVTKNLG